MIDATGRAMFIAAAFTSSALYLFADHMVAIIYGYGRFEQTASILRVNAIFAPLLFFGFMLASAMLVVGRNKAMAIISIIRIALCVVFSWLFIGYWQQRFGNGAIALAIIIGVAEIPAAIACLILLPRGAVGSTTTLNLVRACIASFCTVVPISMLQPLGLLYLIPLYILLSAVTAMVTRLVLPSDLTVRNGDRAQQRVRDTGDETGAGRLITRGASRQGYPEFGWVALVRPPRAFLQERRPSRLSRPR